MIGDECSVCGAALYSGKESTGFYELTHSRIERLSSGEIGEIFPTTTKEYFCGEACLVKFVRERIEPDV